MLEINRNNILNWLELWLDIYDFKDEYRNKLKKFIKTRYKIRRDKRLDEIFGGE